MACSSRSAPIVAVRCSAPWPAGLRSENLLLNLLAVLRAMLLAHGRGGAAGLRVRARDHPPVYGQHLKQILITMGGMIVGEELIKVIWGPQTQIPLPLPTRSAARCCWATRRWRNTG